MDLEREVLSVQIQKRRWELTPEEILQEKNRILTLSREELIKENYKNLDSTAHRQKEMEEILNKNAKDTNIANHKYHQLVEETKDLKESCAEKSVENHIMNNKLRQKAGIPMKNFTIDPDLKNETDNVVENLSTRKLT
jgi:hypothetical protein